MSRPIYLLIAVPLAIPSSYREADRGMHFIGRWRWRSKKF